MESIKKIDIHAHSTLYYDIVPKYPRTGQTMPSPEMLIDFYDKLNIEKGVLLPIVSPESMYFTMTNENCYTIAKQHPDRFIWFCNVDPRAMTNQPNDNLGYILENYIALGAKGLGELTSNMPIDDPQMDNLFSFCEELGLPVTIHIAPSTYGYYGIIDDLGLPRLENALKKHKNLKIFGHSQCFWSEIGDNTEETRVRYPKGPANGGRIAELLRKYENLYCDLSAGSGANAFTRDREHAARFIEEFSDRLLYGCDLCGVTAAFPFDFDAFLTSMRENGEISEENYRKMVRDNAVRLLKL